MAVLTRDRSCGHMASLGLFQETCIMVYPVAKEEEEEEEEVEEEVGGGR